MTLMATFVDTSGLLALLNPADRYHEEAWAVWESLIYAGEPLATSSFVLVETYALLQSRLGFDAVKTMHEEVLPLIKIHWVDMSVFHEAASALLVSHRRSLSLVDCVSFVLMRRLGIRTAFAWDNHFEEQGFRRYGLR
jgi:predicted nucleic acid-binding protein